MNPLRFPDANSETSSASGDAISVDSSSTTTDGQQGAKAPQSLNDYLIEKEIIKTKETDSAKSEDQSSEIQKMNQTDEAAKVEAEKNKVDAEKLAKEKEDLGQEDKSQDGVKTPEQVKAEEQLNNNPRFKEVIEERNQVREQIKQLEPRAQNYEQINSFCQTNAITPEQFKGALEFAALCNIDPEAALKSITPLVEKLQGFTGNKLPADLQEKVDSGKLELSDAKEIATLRSRTEFGSRKLEHERKTYEQQQQTALTRSMGQAAQSWQSAKQKLDPDYKSGSDKFQEVSDKYVAMLHRTDAQGNYMNPVNSATDLVALLEKAYNAVDGLFKKTSGTKPPTRKTLSSNGSSAINGSVNKDPAKARTMQEAMTIGYEQSQARH